MSKFQPATYKKAFLDTFKDLPYVAQRVSYPSTRDSIGLLENQCTVLQNIDSQLEIIKIGLIKAATIESYHIAELGAHLFVDHRKAMGYIYPKLISKAKKDGINWADTLLVETRALKENSGEYFSYLVISKMVPDDLTLISQYTRLQAYKGKPYTISLISTKRTTDYHTLTLLNSIKQSYLDTLDFTPHQIRVLTGYNGNKKASEIAKEMNISTRTLDYHRKEIMKIFKANFYSSQAQSAKTIFDIIIFLNEMGVLNKQPSSQY